ncbi:MAG: AMP-binding protein [Bacteroidetes bacterium]|nr:AMP-binding protein [Bacteroidota bacterium]
MIVPAFHPQLAYLELSAQKQWQESKLQELLVYLKAKSAFYGKMFLQNHIAISKIRTINDLQFLPTTSKNDMQNHNWEFLCVSNKEVCEYNATSGTLGSPVTIALTESDLQRLAYNEQQSFLCANAKAQDIFQLMLTLDRQFMAGMAYYSGLRQIGAAVIRTGPGLPAMQWDVLRRLQSNSLVAVPSFLLKMIDYALEHSIPLNQTSVEKVVCIGEGLRKADFGLNALGVRIQNQWNIALHSTYASTEMQTAFTECGEGKGGHHLPDLLIFEILDDKGNALQEGEYGEVAITTLGVTGMPLLRYRTGDICCFYESPCGCGRKSKRLSPIVGRKKQMIKYKGTTLYPPAIFELLNQQPFISEYLVEVKNDDYGMDEIILHIETPTDEGSCSNILKPLLQTHLRVIPKIVFHPSDTMRQMQFPHAARKQIRFVDKRDNSF